MKEACGEAHLKTILATGELGSLTNVYRASMVCMQAGKSCSLNNVCKASMGCMQAGKACSLNNVQYRVIMPLCNVSDLYAGR